MNTTDMLRSFPQALIFNLSKEYSINAIYGEQRKLLAENFDLTKVIKLSMLFDNGVYNKLLSLLHGEVNSLSITFLNHDYDVYLNTGEDEENSLLYLIDITRFSNVESQLKKSVNDLVSKKEELQAVFDLAANGISILDHNGMFLYANKFFQNMMEYTMEELYSESCISLSSPEYANASETAVEKAIKYGSIQNFRKVCVTKSGLHLNASMSLSYLKSRDEIVMITSDITQDIKYQEELKCQVELEVAKRTEQYEIMCHQSRLAAMGEMIDSIAHQWRQPLNGLGLIVQGLKHISRSETLDKESLVEIESEIMEKINYMSQTIEDFSGFFRISKTKESFDVLHSIEDALRLIDVQLKSHNVKVSIKSKEELSQEVIGFPNEFKQVVMNIVHNAMTAIVKTSQKNGAIDIVLDSVEEKLTICIVDNGGGIEEKNLDKIFDPYFTTRENGSGIGLYMSKVIIEHHMQGYLNVQNHNDGTKFCIELRCKESK
ncbi:MAG: PAS domain S-box-containing protein [Sulfurimonas sp.]|jgi:PAS domain S-box-containing protein|uniref:PAS domain-containing sensor histidine kinase n=1 Tax=Sulfurimonas sp. TaxID=2022749 RepID=UPI0039E68A29